MGFATSLPQKEESILLIDLSYLVHAISFRTKNIYSREFGMPKNKEELYEIDYSLDEEFMAIFNRNFISVLKKLKTEYNTPKGAIVLAADCRKKDIWRMTHFPEYKLHRMIKKKEGLNRGPIFKYVFDKLVPRLEAKDFCSMFSHPVAEGDDIIAVSKEIIRKREPEKQIVILASDHDLLQIIDENTIILTTQNEIVNEKSLGSSIKDLTHKVIMGDKSDGIPPCFKKTKGDKIFALGCGKKTALKLVENKALLKQKLNEYPDAQERFKINMKIVDLRNIPKEVRDDLEPRIEEFLYGKK
jgi:5'-3' exonuclease